MSRLAAMHNRLFNNDASLPTNVDAVEYVVICELVIISFRIISFKSLCLAISYNCLDIRISLQLEL